MQCNFPLLSGVIGAKCRYVFFLLLGGAITGNALAFNPAAGDFSKPVANSVRVMTWNVHNNFIYTSGKDGNYARVIKAANPDIIAFQELDVSLTANQVATRLENYFPGSNWHIYLGKADGSGAGVSNRNAIASRFPLSMQRNDTAPTSALRGVTISLIDLPDGAYAKDLYLMSVHFKAGNLLEEHESRQRHADAITNWMRDARTAGGNVNLPNGTPMLVTGDVNLVRMGDKAPYHPSKTMIDGTIYHNGVYGASSPPDWDGTDNSDAAPYDHTNAEPYTHNSGANPEGRIDRFYYTDSAMHPVAKFIINTQTMSAAALTAGNLNETDTSGASDHLPCVVDFALGASASGKLLVNEFNANDVGADDKTFIELINTSGEEINLEAPNDYWIKASEPLPTSVPATENEEYAYNLKGVVPPGGLFVIYDGAGDSINIKSTIESNLLKLNRQNLAGFYLRNFDYSAFALVNREVVNSNTTADRNVESYGYGAPNPNTTRYFKTNSDNNLTITMGPQRWTSYNAGEIGNEAGVSRILGMTNSNNIDAFITGIDNTPGQHNSATANIVDNSDAGFSASVDWTLGTSAADKYGADYRFRLTGSVSDPAVWTFNVPIAGNYEIYAWWSQGANRSVTAPYILPDSTTVYKDQQTGGGSWQSLGVISLTAGSHQVQLSCWTSNGNVVIGDAIRVYPR